MEHRSCLINNAILSIPISDRKKDTYVWAPSLSRAFSINNAYRVMNVARFGVLSADDKRKWKLLWPAKERIPAFYVEEKLIQCTIYFLIARQLLSVGGIHPGTFVSRISLLILLLTGLWIF